MDIKETAIERGLIHYFVKIREIPKIGAEAAKYKNEYITLMKTGDWTCIPFKYRLFIDFSLLLELADPFANILLEEPGVAIECLKTVFGVIIKVSVGLNIDTDLIALQLRLKPHPNLSLLRYNAHSLSLDTGIFTLRGILVRRTLPIKVLESTVFRCTNSGCLDKTKDRQSFKNIEEPRCELCGRIKIELLGGRIYCDKVIGIIQDLESIKHKRTPHRIQGVSIDFEDDIGSQLELGSTYDVIAKKENGIVEALSVHLFEPIPPNFLPRTPNISCSQSISCLMHLISEHSGDSPWALVNYLASQISADVYPVTSTQLKTGLLLSLGTVGCEYPIPVLGLGDCGRIMSEALEKCERSLYLVPSLSTPLSGTAYSENEMYWLQAGPLLMGSSGLLFIGNIPKFGSDQMSQLCKAVDSEIITLKHKAGSFVPDSDILNYNLRTVVWTYWNINTYSESDKTKLRTLIDTFGMPFFTNIGYNEDLMIETLINYDRRNEHETKMKQKNIIEFIKFNSTKKVHMSSQASDIIRQYFIASRRERPESLPIKTMKVLAALSESHAKLSLRNTVIFEDAVAAIFLYEESVRALFGSSLSPPPPSRPKDAISPLDYTLKMNETMASFIDWLNLYVCCFTSGPSTDYSLDMQ